MPDDQPPRKQGRRLELDNLRQLMRDVPIPAPQWADVADDEPPEQDFHDDPPEQEPEWDDAPDEPPRKEMFGVKYTPLEALPEGSPASCRPPLPPYLPPYDFAEEANLRLKGTVITIKNLPYFVIDTFQQGRDVRLHVSDDTKTYWVQYGPGIDLRPIEPGYITYQGNAWWYNRRPKRGAKQGLAEGNVTITMVGEQNAMPFNPSRLLTSFRKRDPLTFHPSMLEIMPSVVPALRLSNHVAIYHKPDNKNPAVEYKSRKLGILTKDGIVEADDDDVQMSWIHKDLHQVGLSLK